MRCEGMLNVSAVVALSFNLVTMPALLKPELESSLSGAKVWLYLCLVTLDSPRNIVGVSHHPLSESGLMVGTVT